MCSGKRLTKAVRHKSYDAVILEKASVGFSWAFNKLLRTSFLNYFEKNHLKADPQTSNLRFQLAKQNIMVYAIKQRVQTK